MRATFLLSVWLAALAVCSGQRACVDHERCVALNQCPPLARLVSKKNNASAADRAKLRASVCGWPKQNSGFPKVCCPLVPVDDCGPQNNPDRLIGGNLTLVKEFPWAVRLGYRVRGKLQYQCGGALISDRYVLTAAHCIAERKKPVSVRLGEHDVESEVDCSTFAGVRFCADPVVDIDVDAITPHPEYEPDVARENGLWNDIGLLRLRRPVTFTSSVKPVCLPLKLQNGPDDRSNLNNLTMTVVGWGKIASDVFADESRYLMKLHLRAMESSRCQDKYRSFPNRIDKRLQVCAIGKDGQDVCSGDSGGPLTSVGLLAGKVRVILQGVVSFGPTTCATNGIPAVFSRVSHHMPWILSTIRPT